MRMLVPWSGPAILAHRKIENEPRDGPKYLIRSMRSKALMKVGADVGLSSSKICHWGASP